jgi:hypothetical protein
VREGLLAGSLTLIDEYWMENRTNTIRYKYKFSTKDAENNDRTWILSLRIDIVAHRTKHAYHWDRHDWKWHGVPHAQIGGVQAGDGGKESFNRPHPAYVLIDQEIIYVLGEDNVELPASLEAWVVDQFRQMLKEQIYPAQQLTMVSYQIDQTRYKDTG